VTSLLRYLPGPAGGRRRRQPTRWGGWAGVLYACALDGGSGHAKSTGCDVSRNAIRRQV